jgi:hypothetical protein
MTAAKAKVHILSMVLGTFLFLLLGSIVYALLDRQFPSSHWYELNSVIVTGPEGGPVVLGQPIIVTVQRTIHRDFKGEYVTTIRQLPGLHTVCTGGLSVLYRSNSNLPEPLTLGYWTEGSRPPCEEALEPGFYVLQTCVTVQPNLSFLADRQVCRDSPPWEVVAEQVALRCDRIRVSRPGIYHTPASPWYESITHLLDCLDSEAEAAAKGYRRAGE